MTDDPRDILRAAGVECAEVLWWADAMPFVRSDSQAAILALARLVAKYKWQRDWALDGWCCTQETMPERIAVTELAFAEHRPFRRFPWEHKMAGHADCDCALCRDMEGIDDETYFRDKADREASDS